MLVVVRVIILLLLVVSLVLQLRNVKGAVLTLMVGYPHALRYLIHFAVVIYIVVVVVV